MRRRPLIATLTLTASAGCLSNVPLPENESGTDYELPEDLPEEERVNYDGGRYVGLRALADPDRPEDATVTPSDDAVLADVPFLLAVFDAAVEDDLAIVWLPESESDATLEAIDSLPQYDTHPARTGSLHQAYVEHRGTVLSINSIVRAPLDESVGTLDAEVVSREQLPDDVPVHRSDEFSESLATFEPLQTVLDGVLENGERYSAPLTQAGLEESWATLDDLERYEGGDDARGGYYVEQEETVLRVTRSIHLG